MIPTANVPGALAATGRSSEPVPHDEPSVQRPKHVDDLPAVVDAMRAGRAVLLVLDGFPSSAERRRALEFVRGAAYALEIPATDPGMGKDTILLDPEAPSSPPADAHVDAGEVPKRPRKKAAPKAKATAGTCVLCDLRTADREFEPRLEMVVKRDGSRIWSPPAMVCSHCRATIRHWQFALAWCSECERWGRRNVVSPCGHLYG
jgi:hypothetical protein